MIHRSIRRVGNRNNKRIDGLIALGVVFRRANRHPSAEVDLKGVAELRWKKNESMRKMCEARLRGQWTTRALPKESKVLASEVRNAYDSDRQRAELALQLDLVLEKFCARRADVEGRNSVLSLSAYQTLESHYVAHVPPMEDMAKLVMALKTDTPCAEADFFFKHGGTGMWRAWQALTGQGRSYPPKKQTIDWRLEQIGDAATWEPQTEKAPAIASSPIIANSESRPGAKDRPSRWRTFKALKLSAMVMVALLVVSSAYTYIDPNMRVFEIMMTTGSREVLIYIQKQAEGRGDYYYYSLWYSHYRSGNFSKAKEEISKLSSETKDGYTKASCHYTLGTIARESGAPEISIGHLKQAERHLENFGGHPPLSFLINLDLAKSYLESTRINKASDYFQKAEMMSSYSKDFQYYFWETSGRIKFEQGRYWEALDDFKTSEVYIRNDDERFSFHAWVSACFWAQGDSGSAISHIDEASLFATNDWMRAHLNTVRIGVRNCFGQNYNKLEAQVLAWLEKHPNEYLKRKLERAKRCPTPQT